MVRLKDRNFRIKVVGIEFQFHYGTIKRFEQAYKVADTFVFQFHYGTIKRLHGRGLIKTFS